MQTTSQIEIDLTMLDANYAAWRRAVGPDCQICPVVKAGAYGLGAVPIARRLAAGGASMVAVYNMSQANELAAAGLPISILVLMPVSQLGRTDVLYRAAISGRLHLSVHSFEQLEEIEAIGRTFGAKIPVHIEVDTGMCRLGMDVAEADRMIPQIAGQRYVRLAGVFSHTAAPGTDVAFTDQQFKQFQSLLKRHADRLKDVCIHFAGTCAAYRDARYHNAMVRLGLGLFGYGDLADEGVPSIDRPPAVRPILRWSSRIVHTRQVPAGASIGYQRTFITKRPSRLGTVPVGHADGYPLTLSNKAAVRIGPRLLEAPVRGQVNMDQITVDLTDLPMDLGVGSEVELIASDPQAPNALPQLAKLAGSNCYELLCRLGSHIPRHYVVHDRITGRVGHVAMV